MKNHWLGKFRSRTADLPVGYFYCPYVAITPPVLPDGIVDEHRDYEFELDVNSDEIVAKTRKLKCRWGMEAAEDLRAIHNLNAEVELAAVLTKEIMKEIDREIIDNLSICL